MNSRLSKMAEDKRSVPSWFLWIQGIAVPIICVVAAMAIPPLFQMRDQLTTLTVEMRQVNARVSQIDELKAKLHELELQVATMKIETMKMSRKMEQ